MSERSAGSRRKNATSTKTKVEAEYMTEKIKKAEQILESNPYDLEAWSVLIRDAQTMRLDAGRELFEKLVTQFPNSGKYWKIYIEYEIKHKQFEKVEKLFQRCLIKVLNIDLWKTYLNYIKETKAKLSSFREKMAQAYDFALDKIGMDIMSYQIWVDYINFLKSVEAVGSYAENQKITAVRKVYQRGVVNPMMNIDILWRDYCAYENSINQIIAKKMTEDRSRDHVHARRVAKEYEQTTKGLNRNMPSVPPQNAPDECKQVELWKKYIQWEKSNPMKTEDHSLITKRVMFAYEQCLLCLGHHPDVWYEAASYLEQSSKLLTEKGDQNAGKLFADEAAAIYERAVTSTMTASMLIHFAYADFEESRMKYEKVHSIYKKFVAVTDIDPTLAYVQYMKFSRRAEGIKTARSVFKMAREDPRSKFHVFVAAALMEYYCSKDKGIAFKIFELGLKKYGNFPDFIKSYIDYMSHLNEDNNTRVLFERVLSSNQLAMEDSLDIWNQFLDFESNVGDLASIVKVEKRRNQVMEKLQEFEGKETCQLIDRYKYMDLLPCTPMELRALGYKDKHPSTVPSSVITVVSESSGKKADLDDLADQGPRYPKPDTGQMLPFKPRLNVPIGSLPVPGGIFGPPVAVGQLMANLPPPSSFNGPFVIMDKFIETLKNLSLPDGPPTTENGDVKLDPGTAYTLDVMRGGVPRKRKTTNNDESDEEDNSSAPPSNDIYRARQQKRVK